MGSCGSAKEVISQVGQSGAWSEEEFFRFAVSSKHPSQEQASNSDDSLTAVGDVLSTDPTLWTLRPLNGDRP